MQKLLVYISFDIDWISKLIAFACRFSIISPEIIDKYPNLNLNDCVEEQHILPQNYFHPTFIGMNRHKKELFFIEKNIC